MTTSALVSLSGVVCRYGGGTIIRLPAIDIAPGAHTLLLGPSGSGKTTLLNAVCGLQTVTEGSVWLDGTRMDTLPARARDRLRGRTIGLVMQRLHLISALSVRANLEMARRLAGLAPDSAHVNALAEALGLADKLPRAPSALSQGEAQRVAIARALVHRPKLLVADEPTSALDDDNCAAVIALLKEQAAANGATLLVATHDQRLKAHFDHTITLTRDASVSGALAGALA